MSIFAMALSYTDSYKYSSYTVTLAHQVIADWFTRCRLAFRKGFVTLIAKALKSSSFMNPSKKYDDEEKIRLFHADMTDVCLDMMARYSFSLHSSQPKRTPIIEFLLSKGFSQTWIMGNMLVTITTSYGSRDNCLSCSPNKVTDQICSIESSKQKTADCVPHTKPIEQQVAHSIKSKPHVDAKESVSEETSLRADCVYVPQTQEDPIDVVIATGCEVFDNNSENSCEEEGSEPTTPLVEQIVFSNPNVFSPSEQLLFSRQGSKVPMYDVLDDDDSGESDDDFVLTMPYDDVTEHTDILNSSVCDDRINVDDHSIQHADILSHEPSISSARFMMGDDELYETSKNTKEKNKVTTTCQCICEGWAEVFIRRPTGNISWVMRIESDQEIKYYPLSQLLLSASSLEGNKINKRLGKNFYIFIYLFLVWIKTRADTCKC